MDLNPAAAKGRLCLQPFNGCHCAIHAIMVAFSSGLEGQGLAVPELSIAQTRHELSHHNGEPGHME